MFGFETVEGGTVDATLFAHHASSRKVPDLKLDWYRMVLDLSPADFSNTQDFLCQISKLFSNSGAAIV